MGSVAVGTHRRNHQAALKKSFPVDPLRVILQNIPLLAGITKRRLVAFTMAVSAEVRDIGRISGRLRVAMVLGIMSAMTITAKRGIEVPSVRKGAVRAGRIYFYYF